MSGTALRTLWKHAGYGWNGAVLTKPEGGTDTVGRPVKFKKKKLNKICPTEYLIIAQSNERKAAI